MGNIIEKIAKMLALPIAIILWIYAIGFILNMTLILLMVFYALTINFFAILSSLLPILS
jgi:hypothetical protein